MSALGWISDPLSYAFMRNAAAGALAIGIAAPLAGVWAVSRRLVYLTDAMSHAVLAGVAAASLFGASLLLGGMAAALVLALAVAGLVLRASLPEDAAIGLAGQGLFALGVLGVSISAEPRALTHVLFGNPLTVSRADVLAEALVAVLVALGVLAALPLLIATTFDPGHARSLGVSTAAVDTAVIVGVGAVIVLGLTTVGVLMALTLCVAPAVAARLLSDRIGVVLLIAPAIGVVAAEGGLLTAYHTGLPAGPVIAVLAVAAALGATAVAAARRARRPAERPALTSLISRSTILGDSP